MKTTITHTCGKRGGGMENLKYDMEKIKKDVDNLREILTLTWCALSAMKRQIDLIERRLVR